MPRSTPLPRLAVLLLAAAFSSPAALAQPTVSLVADIYPGPTGSNPQPQAGAAFGDALYFKAGGQNDSGVDVGAELFRVTSAGTVELVTDLNPGPSGSFPENFIEFGGALYFSARGNNGSGSYVGHELFRVTSAGTVELVADINLGTGHSNPGNLTLYGGALYFHATGHNGSASYVGTELFRVTSAGVVELVADLYPGAYNGYPNKLTEFGGDLYFEASGPDGSGSIVIQELFRLTSAGAIELVADIHPSIGSTPRDFIEFEGELYFNASGANASGSIVGTELYRVTSAGAVELVEDIHPGNVSSNPLRFTKFGGALYFSAQGEDGSGADIGWELFRVTSAGAVELVADLYPGPGDSSPIDFTEYGDALYFRANSQNDAGEDIGWELFRVTSAGAVELVADMSPGTSSSYPTDFIVFAEELYFQANVLNGSGVNVGTELYRLTSAGAVELVADIYPGTPGGGPSYFIEFDGALYFRASGQDGSGESIGAELFVLREPLCTAAWSISLAAGDHTADTVGGADRDGDNAVGMSPCGTDGLDADLDVPEPAAPTGDYVQLYVEGPATDPTFGDRYMRQYVEAYDLTLATVDFTLAVEASGYDGQEVAVEASAITDLAASADVLVLDGTGAEHDLRAAPYVFTYSGPTTLTLRIGVDPTPGGMFGTGGAAYAPEGTVDAALAVPFTGYRAASAGLEVSSDGGSTWSSAATDLTNPGSTPAEIAAGWEGSFSWTPTSGDVSYGALLRITFTGIAEGGSPTAQATTDPFTVVPSGASFSLASGFQMASPPLATGAQTPNDVFGDGTGAPATALFLFTYTPGSFYALLDNAAATLATGEGVWVGAADAATGAVTGTQLRAAHDRALGTAGSHMIGSPFALPATTAHLSFTVGSETKSYADALVAGWIAAGLYTWDATRGAYLDASSEELTPWGAYWLPVLVDGVTLTVAPPAPAPPSADAVAEDDRPVRVLALSVEHEAGGADRTTALALHADAALDADRFDQPEPPMAPVEGAVRVFAARPDWGGPFAAYDREVQPHLADGEAREWPLVVEAPAGEVTVTWSLPAAPEGQALAFEVVDGVTGSRMAVRDGGTYTFASDGSPRRLTVVVTAAGSVSTAGEVPAVFGATLAPNPARGAGAVLVAAPEAGAVTVEVFDALGRRVAEVRRDVAAGTVRVELPVGALAQGAYVVRVVGPGGAATRRLTVLR